MGALLSNTGFNTLKSTLGNVVNVVFEDGS